jgi:DNA-binding MarR family transcriptional regulator
MSTVERKPSDPETLSDAEAAVGQAFKAAMGAVRRLRGRETHRLDPLSHAQYGLLFGLAEETELSGSQLACSADLSPATVTQMLDHLQDGGLVQRRRSELDKRVVLISLTDRGRELVSQRRARMEDRWQTALSGFTQEELATTAAVLDRLRELFDGYEEEPAA